jgi:hypothetical protein
MYVPRPSDIAWTREHLRVLNDGAIWTVPMNGNRYQKDEANKTMWLVAGEDYGLLERLDANCRALGWRARRATPDVARRYVESSMLTLSEGSGKAAHSLAVQHLARTGMIAITDSKKHENSEPSSGPDEAAPG